MLTALSMTRMFQTRKVIIIYTPAVQAKIPLYGYYDHGGHQALGRLPPLYSSGNSQEDAFSKCYPNFAFPSSKREKAVLFPGVLLKKKINP